ncbi:MAG: rhomboid family intramembrane serine protease [Verrucomicrobiae bacterium]|nr:rhomboid family intramembrane serine protease [Verrucomicrobiae bacterium]
MPDCPTCHTSLDTRRQREGLFFFCPGCHGRAVTFPQIRRVTGDAYITGLLGQLNRTSVPGTHPCPFCSRPMREFHSKGPPLELDACKGCGVVWFDTREFESVPEGAVSSEHEIHLQGLEAMARHRLEQLRKERASDSAPEESWQWVPAIFGFPIESDSPSLRRYPMLTWGLALGIVLVSGIAFVHLQAAVDRFGFLPSEAFRLGGLTWISSFFIHAGFLHLVGNLYFLLIFGDNVEDYLGRWRHGLLILGATLAGNLVHFLFDPASSRPCVGASGGISGIVVFYALQFPHVRLGFLFRYFLRFRWIHMPAWAALVLWLLLQGLGVVHQSRGLSNVAATAHLGGAVAGLGFWLWWRRHELPDAREAAA